MISCEGCFHALPSSLDFPWRGRDEEVGASHLWTVLFDKEETVVDVTLYPDAVLVPPLLLILCISKGQLILFLVNALLLELTSSEMHALTGQADWMHPPFSFRTALTELVLPYKSLSCFRFDFQFLCSGLLAGLHSGSSLQCWRFMVSVWTLEGARTQILLVTLCSCEHQCWKPNV